MYIYIYVVYGTYATHINATAWVAYHLHALENLVYFIIKEGSAHSAHIKFRNKIEKCMLIVWNTFFLLI